MKTRYAISVLIMIAVGALAVLAVMADDDAAASSSLVQEGGLQKSAYLGVATSPVEAALGRQLGLPTGVGLVVDHIDPASAAAKKLEKHDVLRKLKDRLGDDILTCTTIFNPWATLRHMTIPPSDKHGPPKLVGEDERDARITELLKEDRSAVKAAIEAIGGTLAAFAAECIAVGAAGIFLSVRDDWVNRPVNGPDTYDEILRAVDLQIIEAASAGTFNVLHVCGRPQDFLAFADYPVHVINWADRAAGPSIAYARDHVKPDIAIAGGVDNLKTLPEGTPEDCASQVRDALRQAKDRPIIIAAGCTFDPDAVPPENLKAVVAAARQKEN